MTEVVSPVTTSRTYKILNFWQIRGCK